MSDRRFLKTIFLMYNCQHRITRNLKKGKPRSILMYLKDNGTLVDDSHSFLIDGIKIDRSNPVSHTRSEINPVCTPQQDTFVFNSDGTTMTTVCTPQQNSSFINNSEFNIVTSSAYTPSDFSSNPDSDNFATLADVVITDFEISSFDEFLRSDKENAFQFLKNYFQRNVIKEEYVEPIQLFFFVLILVSIFSQLFGGNRDLPIE